MSRPKTKASYGKRINVQRLIGRPDRLRYVAADSIEEINTVRDGRNVAEWGRVNLAHRSARHGEARNDKRGKGKKTSRAVGVLKFARHAHTLSCIFKHRAMPAVGSAG